MAVLAGDAWAALFLTFSTTRATPGAVVSVRTGGNGALPSIPEGSPPLRVFLTPADEADTITSPRDSRLRLLGRLRVDEEGNGRLRFIVPDVAPGEYTTLTHCVPCAPFSAGRALLPPGPFRGSFVVIGDGDGFPFRPVVLGAVGALLVVGGAVGWRATQRRSARVRRLLPR